MKKLNYFGLLCICSLAGCANLDSVYRPLNTTQGTGALIDIKQRAILVNQNHTKDANKPTYVMCAEPSPDALAAYAAELAGSLKNNAGVGADIKAAFQESAAFVGQRTPSIQLLRDAMYRTCEAYANGAIDEDDYELLMRRYQRHTVALMAIEQLTSATRVPPITINTNGQVGGARPLAEWSAEIDKAQSDIRALEAEKKADTEGKKTTELDQKIKAKSDSIAAMRDKMALGTVVAGAATASVIDVKSGDSTGLSAIATHVRDITMTTIDVDDTGPLCFNYLRKLGSQEAKNASILALCTSHLDMLTQERAARAKAAEQCRKDHAGYESIADCMKGLPTVSHMLSAPMQPNDLDLPAKLRKK